MQLQLSIGAIVAPFAQGPVDSPYLVTSEADLLKIFGEPYETGKQYESWMVASSFLAYGGSLQVVRADDDQLTNSFVGAASSVKIKSDEHYEQLGYDNNTITDVTFAARNPGSWANGIRVATIDSYADQIITMSTSAVSSFTEAIADRVGTSVGSGTTIGISTASISVGDVVRSTVVAAGTTVTRISTAVLTLSNTLTNTTENTFFWLDICN